jgi:hypothetical protein
MARPVKVRTTEAFARDLQTLAHLRTAILLDGELEHGRARSAVTLIDNLTDLLLEFSREKELDSEVMKVSGE